MKISKEDTLNTFYIYQVNQIILILIPVPYNCTYSWGGETGLMSPDWKLNGLNPGPDVQLSL